MGRHKDPRDLGRRVEYAPEYKLDIGSDAMARRMQAMVSYNTLRQDGKASGAEFLVTRKHTRKAMARDPTLVNDDRPAKDVNFYEFGCSTVGIREDLGVEEYQRHVKEKEELAWANETRHEEDEENDELRRVEIKKMLKASELRVHPFQKHDINHRSMRAQMPGWDPFMFAQRLLDVEAEKLVDLRADNTNKKRTRKMLVNTRVCLDLQRPGPTSLNPVDYAKHLAKAEGLTLGEWCKEQDAKIDKQLERDRLKLIEAQRKAQAEASDPRPDYDLLHDGEIMVIARRHGGNALEASRFRKLKAMHPVRRVRDCATMASMMLLRSQGFGLVTKEQDVVWIEPELLMGGERVTEDRDRLLALGITHILKCGPAYHNQFGDDFIYCRIYVNDRDTVRQDILRVEYGMGMHFVSNALDLGGRVLVVCPSGCRLSACCVIGVLMAKRKMRLSTAMSLVKIHEPDAKIPRSLALFLSLYEIELHHETSVKRDRIFTNPHLKTLVETLELPIALPWFLPVYFLSGYMTIPDPYAFWNGHPRTDRRSLLRKTCGCCCCFWTFEGPRRVWRAFRRILRKYTVKEGHDEALAFMEDDSVVTAASTVVSAGGIAFDDASAASEASESVGPPLPPGADPATSPDRPRRISEVSFDGGDSAAAAARDTSERRKRKKTREVESKASLRRAAKKRAMNSRRVAVAAKYAEGDADDASLATRGANDESGGAGSFAGLDFLDDASLMSNITLPEDGSVDTAPSHATEETQGSRVTVRSAKLPGAAAPFVAPPNRRKGSLFGTFAGADGELDGDAAEREERPGTPKPKFRRDSSANWLVRTATKGRTHEIAKMAAREAGLMTHRIRNLGRMRRATVTDAGSDAAAKPAAPKPKPNAISVRPKVHQAVDMSSAAPVIESILHPGTRRKPSFKQRALRVLPKRLTHRERGITITY